LHRDEIAFDLLAVDDQVLDAPDSPASFVNRYPVGRSPELALGCKSFPVGREAWVDP
jgi:hypothetical protein